MMHIWTKNKCLQLFANCIPVKGAKRSIICDLGRASYHYIPNDLYELLKKFEGASKEIIYKEYGTSNQQVLNEYFAFLEHNEFIFWCDPEEIPLFPKIDMSYRVPYEITNSIIDLDSNSKYDIKKVITQLIDLNCSHIQIRSYVYKETKFWQSILDIFEKSSVRSIEIFSKWSDSVNFNEALSFAQNNPRIVLFVYHTCPIQSRYITETGTPVIFLSQKLESSHNCGQISSNYFAPNLNTFNESQNFNTCLNRKISIDVNGNIKNCPSMSKNFGNISDTKLQDALLSTGFKDLWHVKKDQITVCKDCEFRYICTDCRAFLNEEDINNAKPAKCTYNPYEATWEGPSENPLSKL